MALPGRSRRRKWANEFAPEGGAAATSPAGVGSLRSAQADLVAAGPTDAVSTARATRPSAIAGGF